MVPFQTICRPTQDKKRREISIVTGTWSISYENVSTETSEVIGKIDFRSSKNIGSEIAESANEKR